MEPATSKEKDEPQTRQERVPEVTKIYSIRFPPPGSAGQTLVRKGQHLDVDAVLARSLPQTFSQLSSFKPETKAGR